MKRDSESIKLKNLAASREESSTVRNSAYFLCARLPRSKLRGMRSLLRFNNAAKFKNDISVLWLIAPGGVISPQPSELSQMLKSGDRNPLVAENEEEYDQLLDFVFVKRPTIPGAIKRYLVEEAINHRPLNQIIYKQITSTDTKNFVPLEILLKDNKIKTLILWGDKDRVLHMSAAKKLESVMPNAKSVIMKDVGHVPMVEKPEDSANIFLSFLGKN